MCERSEVGDVSPPINAVTVDVDFKFPIPTNQDVAPSAQDLAKNKAATIRVVLVDSRMVLLSPPAWRAQVTTRTADGTKGNKTENQKPSRKVILR